MLKTRKGWVCSKVDTSPTLVRSSWERCIDQATTVIWSVGQNVFQNQYYSSHINCQSFLVVRHALTTNLGLEYYSTTVFLCENKRHEAPLLQNQNPFLCCVWWWACICLDSGYVNLKAVKMIHWWLHWLLWKELLNLECSVGFLLLSTNHLPVLSTTWQIFEWTTHSSVHDLGLFPLDCWSHTYMKYVVMIIKPNTMGPCLFRLFGQVHSIGKLLLLWKSVINQY